MTAARGGAEPTAWHLRATALRHAGLAAALAMLAACAPHPATPVAPPSMSPYDAAHKPAYPAAGAAVTLAHSGTPLSARITYPAADLTAALAAFRGSCPALVRRTDSSGLTGPGDWTAVCTAAATTTDARAFFREQFVAVEVGSGRGLDTGYYEPDLAAALTPGPDFAVPIYRRPPDLIDLDLGTFDAALAGKHIRGRIAGGRFVPYYDRGEIDDGTLAGRKLEVAWAADPYAAFFLEIQGSGRLRLPDGATLRVGYDGQNGHAYTGIGKLLRDRGALGPGQATMAGIIGWMRAHPDDGRALMRANRSKVFFKVLDLAADRGPPGALGVPLTPRVSVAADPAFVPLGAPAWLETTVAGAPLRTIVVAQDTGGAIKGANRLDLFWGSGDAAGKVAGGITATGSVTVLLPPVAAARITAAATGSVPRRLGPDETALWARVAASVRPLPGRAGPVVAPAPRPIRDRAPDPSPPPPRQPGANRVAVDSATLDGGWDRKVRTGRMLPDRTIDLHGYSRDRAHALLTRLVIDAAGAGARVLLVITGKGAPADDDAARPRGLIRASLRDWLDAPDLRPYIAALRPAHPRHGGGGAWYVILRR